MFMRAVLSEEARVGLLLFDEPSAALDPTAEHGMSMSVSRNLQLPDWRSIRPVHADPKVERRKNDDFLVPSIWSAN